MIGENYSAILTGRLPEPDDKLLYVRSKLAHFALINYALPKSRLEQYIPKSRFDIPEFMIGGRPMAMMSAVPFLDADFHFIKLFPFLKFSFGQTNYRVYVVDRKTGQHCVWFFGTTLGSVVVNIPRALWHIPWHRAKYSLDCTYNTAAERYDTFRYDVSSDWAAARIDVQDTGKAVTLTEGFASMAEQVLILTHPVDGFFYRLDGAMGSYSVWHHRIPCTVGVARDLYFSLYERLGLLSKEEMQKPHSVFLCPETEFKVLLPPVRIWEQTGQ